MGTRLIDMQGLLDGPTYAAFGSDATITSASSGGAEPIKAIDLTRGVALDLKGTGIQSVLPAAKVRRSELRERSIEPGDVDGGTLVLNRQEWRIKAHRPVCNVNGEDTGELYLILTKGQAS